MMGCGEQSRVAEKQVKTPSDHKGSIAIRISIFKGLDQFIVFFRTLCGHSEMPHSQSFEIRCVTDKNTAIFNQPIFSAMRCGQATVPAGNYSQSVQSQYPFPSEPRTLWRASRVKAIAVYCVIPGVTNQIMSGFNGDGVY